MPQSIPVVLVNPLTAWAPVDEARKGGHRGIVVTAAAGQLGPFLLRSAADAGFSVIAIVRRKEQEGRLQSLGAHAVLNSESEDLLIVPGQASST